LWHLLLLAFTGGERTGPAARLGRRPDVGDTASLGQQLEGVAVGRANGGEVAVVEGEDEGG